MGPAYLLFLRRRSVSFLGFGTFIYSEVTWNLGNPRKKSSFRSIFFEHSSWFVGYLIIFRARWAPNGHDYLKIWCLISGGSLIEFVYSLIVSLLDNLHQDLITRAGAAVSLSDQIYLTINFWGLIRFFRVTLNGFLNDVFW